MNRRWTDEEIELLKNIYREKNDEELSIIFNRPISAILTKMCRLGLCRNEDYNRPWNELEEQFLRNNYSNGDLIEVTKILNRTKKSVTERAKILQLKRDPELVRANGHQYNINEDFFKTWSDDMAYILGMIWTDGCMHDEDYKIDITQHKKDKYILTDIYKVLKSNKSPYRSKNTFVLSIFNKIIYNDLKNIGLSQRKSKTVAAPIGLPDKYTASFIRGALDGDGSVSTKGKRIKISTASRQFAEDIGNMLKKLGIENKIYNEPYVFRNGKNIKLCDRTEDDTKTDFFNIRVMKKKDLSKLYHLMYDNAKLYLKRKKQAFIDMGIEEPDFLIKNKHLMRKIEGANDMNEKVYFDQVKLAKQNGFMAIDRALSSGRPYKGYIWKYVGDSNVRLQ